MQKHTADALSGSAKAIDVIYLQREVEWLQMAAGLHEMKHLGAFWWCPGSFKTVNGERTSLHRFLQ